VGTVLTPDAGYYARAAMLAAGIPETVPVQVINRFCSSGLMAVTTVANQIRSGQIEIGLAIGIESMSEKYVLAVSLRRLLGLIIVYIQALIKVVRSLVNSFLAILLQMIVRKEWDGPARMLPQTLM
jgi:hypothetical protein